MQFHLDFPLAKFFHLACTDITLRVVHSGQLFFIFHSKTMQMSSYWLHQFQSDGYNSRSGFRDPRVIQHNLVLRYLIRIHPMCDFEEESVRVAGKLVRTHCANGFLDRSIRKGFQKSVCACVRTNAGSFTRCQFFDPTP